VTPAGTPPRDEEPSGQAAPSSLSSPAAVARLAELRAVRTGRGDARIADIAIVTPDEVEDLAGERTPDAVQRLMVALLDAAATVARPPISGYRVGAVGQLAGGGLVLGGNLEFPGASIHHTVHAEGFVALRSRAVGEAVTRLALSSARPCAHCRQVLAEFAWAGRLRIVDPAGHDRSLDDVYPWPFLPAALGMTGVPPQPSPETPEPALNDPALPDDVTAALRAAGRLAHAPYTRSVAAIVLRLGDGALVPGSVLESVAFNPTIGPLQDALVGVVAHGREPGGIETAWLAVGRDAAADHIHATRDLLAASAPAATLHVTYWD
jgi:cytidine deaminase